VAVHDCDLVISGLRVMLEPHVDRIRLVHADRPHAADLLLIDPFAPNAAASRELYRQHEASIVLFTWLGTDDLDTWLHAPGVLGHLLKTASADELVSAIETMALYGTGLLPVDVEAVGDDLSDRERQMLRLVSECQGSQLRPSAAQTRHASPRRFGCRAAVARGRSRTRGQTVGHVTSVARHYELGPVALAVIKRGTDPTAELLARTGSLDVPAAQEVIEPPDAGAAATVPRLPRLDSKRR